MLYYYYCCVYATTADEDALCQVLFLPILLKIFIALV